MDSYLRGEAANWVERTPAIRNLLNDNTLGQRTAADVTTFKDLFFDYF